MNRRSAQPESPFSFELLDACCRMMAKRVDDKPNSEWTSLEYKRLSGMLSRETDVLLSETTLKRIFGRLKTSERYFPQKATRDALARFVGYRDWQEFELVYQAQRQPKPASPEIPELPAEIPAQPSAPPVTEVNPSIPRKRNWKVGILALAVLLVAGVIAMIMLRPVSGYEKVKNLQLRCLNPIGGVPHSAIFQLVSDKPIPPEAHDLEIMWGEHKKGMPFRQSYTANHLYQWPGIQYAVLSYKGKPIDTVTVQMRTRGWVANAINDLDSIRAFPVNNLKELPADNLYASITDLAKAGVDTLDSFIVGFSNIKPSTIDGDNFELKVRVTASETRPGTRCPYVLVLVQGERDNHYVRMALPNCTALTNHKFSELDVDGEREDLRHISLDLRKGADVVLRISDKKAELIVNGVQLLQSAYQQSVGNIMGLKFAVNGTGRIENPVLTDNRTGERY